MKLPRLLLAAALLTCGLLPLRAQVPQIINYQGKVTVGATPFVGTGQFRFALVDGTGATTYWSNDGTSNAGSQPTAAVALPVVNGLYFVPLGDATLSNMTAVPVTVFANGDVRLRVWFDDGVNGAQLLAPDQRITSVGYAMVAGTVPDGAITSAKLAPGAVGGAQLAAGSVGTNQLGFGAVQMQNLAGGSVGPGQIGTGVVNGGHVADGSIQTADLAPGVAARYDRQEAKVAGALNVNSPTLVDLAGVSLTTKSLGGNGHYRITFNTLINVSGGGAQTFINVNGVDVPTSEGFAVPTSSVPWMSVASTAVVPSLAAGTVIKVRGRVVSGGTVQFYNPQLFIDGVPASQVVP